MVQEARLGTLEGGLYPETEGWFVVNTREALWWQSEKAGRYVRFEGKEAARFPEFGINIHVLAPGEPNCMYHARGRPGGLPRALGRVPAPRRG